MKRFLAISLILNLGQTQTNCFYKIKKLTAYISKKKDMKMPQKNYTAWHGDWKLHFSNNSAKINFIQPADTNKCGLAIKLPFICLYTCPISMQKC